MRVFAAAALALALAAGCGPQRDGAEQLPTFEVLEAATFVHKVKSEGTLEAVEATPITAPRDSETPMKIAWLAEDGSQVSEGDVIVRFDDAEAQRKRADSSDDISAAQREIAKVRAQSGAMQHKRGMTAALADFESEVAREFSANDQKILSRNEIIESTIDVDLAEAKAAHSKKLSGIERSVASHELQLHRIDENRANREFARADEVLSQLEVLAPHDGILVLSRNWRGEAVRVGDTVWRGQKLGELPHAAKMQAAMFVLEADAGRVVAELPAELRIEAHPETSHTATVQRVDTLAKPRHPDVPVHYVGITLALETTDPKLMRIGQRVTAVIVVEEPDAIAVPRQAIFDRNGKTIVYRREGDSYEAVEVELGMASAGRVVIPSGLSPGDVVALRDPNRADEVVGARGDDKKDGEHS
ncbi:MAG: HlyD family efflux transporter periplasmic adaptor subunit [Nannocystaceae bacterium]|nr:HlyD family efflux transporter periplasmic adaptor subunit [Nannocystaceae bacterium]